MSSIIPLDLNSPLLPPLYKATPATKDDPEWPRCTDKSSKDFLSQFEQFYDLSKQHQISSLDPEAFNSGYNSSNSSNSSPDVDNVPNPTLQTAGSPPPPPPHTSTPSSSSRLIKPQSNPSPFISIGLNEATRALNKGICSIFVISVPKVLFRSYFPMVPYLSALLSIPVITVMNTSEELGKIFGRKSVQAFSINFDPFFDQKIDQNQSNNPPTNTQFFPKTLSAKLFTYPILKVTSPNPVDLLNHHYSLKLIQDGSIFSQFCSIYEKMLRFGTIFSLLWIDCQKDFLLKQHFDGISGGINIKLDNLNREEGKRGRNGEKNGSGKSMEEKNPTNSSIKKQKMLNNDEFVGGDEIVSLTKNDLGEKSEERQHGKKNNTAEKVKPGLKPTPLSNSNPFSQSTNNNPFHLSSSTTFDGLVSKKNEKNKIDKNDKNDKNSAFSFDQNISKHVTMGLAKKKSKAVKLVDGLDDSDDDKIISKAINPVNNTKSGQKLKKNDEKGIKTNQNSTINNKTTPPSHLKTPQNNNISKPSIDSLLKNSSSSPNLNKTPTIPSTSQKSLSLSSIKTGSTSAMSLLNNLKKKA